MLTDVAPGDAGEGDALVSPAFDLALGIVTADCVPVLVATPHAIAAAHAGWRGIAARIVPATVEALVAHHPAASGAPGTPGAPITAWIGPAIGPCCYETAPEVAAQVAAASHPAIIQHHSGARPHLDLQAAVRHQLRESGVTQIHTIPLCTHCQPTLLHSYRRECAAPGRNHAFIWRQPL